ncbi:hypothetical protein VN97_g13226 [Penicillium thymicola]|uniref:Uncharacterized protein n=1 Tax=Penicillium thymicola TaxID=293382 RepID=A0AAI9T536_PENTH|nr:hypothetical protein VN97_g13226 [Penicillium thymicola]
MTAWFVRLVVACLSPLDVCMFVSTPYLSLSLLLLSLFSFLPSSPVFSYNQYYLPQLPVLDPPTEIEHSDGLYEGNPVWICQMN